MQDKIFGLFEQGDSGAKGGLGIGLTLVKSLVEMHGGSVAVESGGPGRGSTFTLVMPVLTEENAAHEVKAEPKVPRSGPARVLVVDDGRNAADILAMFFQMEGFVTAVAYDGAEAVETARSFEPDLVCMDLGMPRMDGFEAAREIRRNGRGATLVALSGWGADGDRQRSAEAGFDMHLVKPVKPDDLRAIIAQFFSKQESASPEPDINR
jgi:CheY-like chemotaxis protein